LIGKALFHIKWPDTEFEDYDYNKAIVDEIVRQGLCMCTVPDSVKYLYTLHPAGSRNQPR